MVYMITSDVYLLSCRGAFDKLKRVLKKENRRKTITYGTTLIANKLKQSSFVKKIVTHCGQFT